MKLELVTPTDAMQEMQAWLDEPCPCALFTKDKLRGEPVRPRRIVRVTANRREACDIANAFDGELEWVELCYQG